MKTAFLVLNFLFLSLLSVAQPFTLLKDINTGADGSVPQSLINVNGTLFFTADEGINGEELWKSDGTAAGTVLVKDINTGTNGSSSQYLTNVNGTLFFYADDGINGQELWKSDGTSAGTVLVKDINSGPGNSIPISQQLVNVNGILLFSAFDGVNGQELWRSDGTSAGTVIVKDIYPGVGGSYPQYLAGFNNTLFFEADDAVHGQEIWKSDGTAAGTVMVKDINNGVGSSYPAGFTNVNGTIFFIAYEPTTAYELWKTDGSASGTVLLKDITPGAGNSIFSWLTNVNGTLFFTVDDIDNGINEFRLWKSDGTEAGTVLVKDINGAADGSNPNNLAAVNNQLLFQGNDGINGDEVWKSDGTTAGTVLFQDVVPGNGSSMPNSFTVVGGIVYAIITDNAHGEEVWSTNIASVLPLHILEFSGKIENGKGMLYWKTQSEQAMNRFEVERSIDGKNFTKIGTVSAMNANGIHDYDFTDGGLAGLRAPVVYYRLKMIDENTKHNYSSIVPLRISGKGAASILYPNPAKANINLVISTQVKDRVSYRVIDIGGRVVGSGQMNLNEGSNQFLISTDLLSAGIFTIEVNGKYIHEKLVFVKE